MNALAYALRQELPDVSDEQIVEMVEKAIHDHPKELPLLNKYYK